METPATPVQPVTFDSIEQQKENIQPLSQGRSAKALSAVFTQEGHERSRTLAKGHAEFAKELNCLDELDDPLEVFTRYIKWTVENYPQGHNHESNLVPLLERATRTLKDDARYRADPRYLKCWILYSKYVETAKDVFVFLLINEIGTSLASLYEEYAAVLEGSRRRADADEIYRLGIARSAQPLERLNKRYRQFLARTASQPLTNEDQPATVEGPAPTPTYRRGAGFEARSVLGSRTPSQHLSDLNGVSGGRWSGATADPSPSVAPRSNLGRMTVFADQNGAAQHRTPSAHEIGASGWDDFGTNSTRRKENTLESTPWDGVTLAMKKGARLFKPSSRLEVFRDDDEEKEEGEVGRKAYDDAEDVFFRTNAPSEAELLMKNPFKNYIQSFDFSHTIPRPQQPPSSLPSLTPQIKSASTLGRNGPSKGTKEKIKVKLPEKLVVNMDLVYSNGQEYSFEEIRASCLGLLGKIWTEQVDYQIALKDVDSSTPNIEKAFGASAPSPTVNTKAALADIMDMFNQPLEGDDSDDSEEDSDASSTEDGKHRNDEDAFRSLPLARDHESIESPDSHPRPIFNDENAYSGPVPATPMIRNTIRTPFAQSGQQAQRLLKRDDIVNEEEGDEEADLLKAEDLGEQIELGLAATTPCPKDFVMEFDAPLSEENRNPPRGRGGRFNGINLMTPIAESTSEFSVHSIGPMTGLKQGLYGLPETPAPIGGSHAREILTDSILKPRMLPLQESIESLEQLHLEDPSRRPTIKEKADQKKVKLPWIPANPCNPHDEDYINAILGDPELRLSRFSGFVDLGRQKCGKFNDLRKGHKLPSAKTNGAATTTPSRENTGPLSTHKVLIHDGRVFEVQAKLGEGGFGCVYLCKEEAGDDDDDDKDGSTTACAIKVQKPAHAWEFFMLRRMEDRLSARALKSIIRSDKFFLYSDESHLVLDYHGQGTLLDAVNNASAAGISTTSNNSAGGLGFDETLAMFFSVELIRTVEALHDAEILHGDLKIDNCLIRLSSSDDNTMHLGQSAGIWSSNYQSSGVQGWSERGLVLIDFGRAIDLTMFPSDQSFVAEWETDKHDCFEMREMRPWTYQADYFGLAGIIHVMLFGKYIETTTVLVEEREEDESTDGGIRRPRYRCSASWKRYWQHELWERLFDILLNPKAAAALVVGGALPITKSLRQIRREMEDYLEQNGHKNGKNLRMLLRRLETFVHERRR